MTAEDVAGVMALATLAISFVIEPETWPVFVAWVNRPELGPEDPFETTRAEAERIWVGATQMTALAMEMATR